MKCGKPLCELIGVIYSWERKQVNKNMKTFAEGMEVENCPSVEIGGQSDMSKGDSLVMNNKKGNNKKKKRGRNKKVGIKFQIKKEEPVSLNINKKWDDIRTPLQKRKETEEAGAAENDATQNTANDEVKSEKKTKKAKRRNNKDFTFNNPKMELTPSLHQETEGRTSHRDNRTLYVRFPSSLSIREKSSVQPMVPTAVAIRFPRLSPGNFAKFCYIEFETEEETSLMKEKIEKIEVNGEAFYADFVGRKSKAYDEKEARTVDPLRLYVGGLPRVQTSDIRAVFPTASQILYRKANQKVSQSYAYIIYKTHEEALKVFNDTRDLKIQGKEVIVIFAAHKSGMILKENETQPAKRQKT